MIDRRQWMCAALTILAAGSLAACAQQERVPTGQAPPEPLKVYGSTATLEIAPVLLAVRDHYPSDAVVRDGGIGNLVGAAPVPGFGSEGLADVATHAETQALRYSVQDPDIRIILTVTEGRYRIVARRSAGIAGLADLEGKRIATLATTSAGYFLSRMLAGEGLDFADVEAVRISPIEDMADALARREVDAVAIWEPHAGNAVHALGEDAIEFSGDGVYRELFNLNTTAANLADPAKRSRIVAFVRSIIDASQAIEHSPAEAQQLVAATAGTPREQVVRAWPTLGFAAHIPEDLLDVLVEEERWLAAQEGRTARPAEDLAKLIDRSVYAEAVGK